MLRGGHAGCSRSSLSRFGARIAPGRHPGRALGGLRGFPGPDRRCTLGSYRRRVVAERCPEEADESGSPLTHGSSSDVEASARRSTGSWPTRSPAGAGSPSCAARRAWARARCSTTCPTGSPAGTSRGRPASSRRWSWPTPACTSSARRCSSTSTGFPRRSATRSRPCSACSAGAAPDRFLVGLATLTLLAEVAEQQPLVCIVDDAQWLDQASAQILGLRGPPAPRRADRGRVRRADGDRRRRPRRASRVPGPRARRRATHARSCWTTSPARWMPPSATRSSRRATAIRSRCSSCRAPGTSPDLAGGFGLPGSQPVAGRIEQSYVRRLRLLPPTRSCSSSPRPRSRSATAVLLHRPRRRSGSTGRARPRPQDAGLLELGGRVEFAHPLVRSAAYRSAAADDRHRVHRALAEATDAETDPDRRAWHRARATPGPDEEVAAELERSAGRAQARGGRGRGGGVPAARRRADGRSRRGDPARAGRGPGEPHAGAFDAALGAPGHGRGRPARTSTQRAQWLCCAGRSRSPPGAARRGPAAAAGGPEARAIRPRPRPRDLPRRLPGGADRRAPGARRQPGRGLAAPPGPCLRRRTRRGRADLLLDGLTLLVTDGPTAAAPMLRRATSAFAGQRSRSQTTAVGWMTPMAGARLWDDQGYSLVEGPVQLARETGALDRLPMLLNQLADAAVWRGRLSTGAASLIAEADAVCEATGARVPPYAALLLAAFRGREAEAAQLIEATVEQATAARAGGRGDLGTLGTPCACTTASAATTTRWRRPGRSARPTTRASRRPGAGRARRGRRADRDLDVARDAPRAARRMDPGGGHRLGAWRSRRAAGRC